jgi:hypothetical protein
VTQTIHATEHFTPDTLCAFIDGELAAWSHRTIQQHLVYCHSCTVRALSATRLQAAIRQVGVRFNPCAFDSPDWDRIPEKDPGHAFCSRGNTACEFRPLPPLTN